METISENTSELTADDPGKGWRRYAQKHKPCRVSAFPPGIEGPKKVRIYRRPAYYMVQWWDPSQKTTLAERVEGDLIEAICRARAIDQRLENFGRSGRVASRIGHADLVSQFQADMWRRAGAGELDVSSVRRYSAPLEGHYLPFTQIPEVARRYRHAGQVDRNFQLEFSQFLQNRHLQAKGGNRGLVRPMISWTYVLDVVRSMYQWAADPDRGGLLPDGFRSPFVRASHGGRAARKVGPSEPDISLPMALDFLASCNAFQLPIFSTLLLYGLRPGELGWIFQEHVSETWLRVPNLPELGYFTKGRRDKQFPLLACIQSLLGHQRAPVGGLVFRSRRGDRARCVDKRIGELAEELQRRRSQSKNRSVVVERQLRDRLLEEAGQLRYDHINVEFKRIAGELGWPKSATLKDFRHLFSTALENAGVPECYRKYYMGHSLGRSAIVTYTHLNKLQEHFYRATKSELAPIVDAITQRAKQIGSNSKEQVENE